MKRIGRVFLTFCLFGGSIGLLVFLSLQHGLNLPDWVAIASGVSSGLIIGAIGCQSRTARTFAAYLTEKLHFLGWLTR